MPSNNKDTKNARQDVAVADSFPASDPPSGTGESGSRAVPPEQLIGHSHPPRRGAVTLSRRFDTVEAAKLALESLVRMGPIDPDTAEIEHQGKGAELRIAAPPADADRLRGLLAKH